MLLSNKTYKAPLRPSTFIRTPMANRIMQAFKTTFVDYFSLHGFIENQSDIETDIRQGVSFKGTNIVILIMAILIASLGLNTNSTAVIIGAMLISPLMGPIIGIGLGIGVMDYTLLRRSLRNLAMAAGFSIIASTAYFLISPVSEGHSELLARTSPTIYDVLIAFFGGGAGIIGIASTSKGNVIPGVAIATALMPPLCTVGYGLATWQPHYFLGALYLFLINSIFIALATFIGVKLLKFNAVKVSDPIRAKRVRRVVYIIAVLTLLPSIYLTYNMLRESRFSINAQRFVTAQMQFPETRVVSEHAYMKNGQKYIDITLLGKILPADSLKLALSPKLSAYGLEGVSLNIIQGDMALNENTMNPGTSTSDIYNLSQKVIAMRQATIDSLTSVIAAANMRDTIGATMAPELKVIFPQVADIAISRNVFCDVANGSLDTLEVALVRYSHPIDRSASTKLRDYLRARLAVADVRLVDVSGHGW